MSERFDIRSFNFITWHWKDDVEMQEIIEEINYQIDNCNINAVTFSFAAIQEHCYSTEIDWQGHHMPTDDDLSKLIHYCQERGLKTIVKPMLNVADGYWRAFIRFFDEDVPCEPKWRDWFKSYNEYLVHYGQLCENNNVDMLIIGCELVGTDHREQEWRNLIGQLRMVYNGLLTYNCDKYQEHNVKWWDALDYISSSGYYPQDKIGQELDRIEKVVNKYKLPFIFTEMGCPSVEGTAKIPNDWSLIEKGNSSEDEQYNYLKDFFEECSKRDFVKGLCIWDWPMNSPKKACNKLDGAYSVKFKKAEKVVKKYFSI